MRSALTSNDSCPSAQKTANAGPTRFEPAGNDQDNGTFTDRSRRVTFAQFARRAANSCSSREVADGRIRAQQQLVDIAAPETVPPR